MKNKLRAVTGAIVAAPAALLAQTPSAYTADFTGAADQAVLDIETVLPAALAIFVLLFGIGIVKGALKKASR